MFVTLAPIAALLDDAQLVEAAQHGDRAALDQLLRRHYERVHAICRRIAGGRRDADDACQEAMIKIVRSLPRFDGRSSFGTWAYRVATNAALDELRRRQRRPALRAVGDDDGSEEPADELAERRTTSVEDRLALDEALAELGEDFRVAVVLRDVADLDYDEIAAVLEVPIGTVKSRIARGRRALADRLRIEDLPDVSGDDGHALGDTGNRAPGARRPTRVDPAGSSTPPNEPDLHPTADEPTSSTRTTDRDDPTPT